MTDPKAAVGHKGPPRLRERFGDLRLPYVSLGTLPTAVERLDALGAEIGCELWVKRDDRSGDLYGGNKVRKLELLLADALAHGCTRVSTFGAYGSHHCLATATYARSLGLDARLALTPQPLTPHVLDDLILSHSTGAELVHVPSGDLMPELAARWGAESPEGEVIPVGGSSALGTVGFVEAALELADQIAAGELPKPDFIFLPAGTCGTASGLALGLELAGVDCTIVAVQVVPAVITNQGRIAELRASARALLEAAGLVVKGATGTVEVILDSEEFGAGYGVPTPAAESAMERFAAQGAILETTYTGKAAAGLLRWAAGAASGKRVLFWNTFSSGSLDERLAAADPREIPEPFRSVLRESGRLNA